MKRVILRKTALDVLTDAYTPHPCCARHMRELTAEVLTLPAIGRRLYAPHGGLVYLDAVLRLVLYRVNAERRRCCKSALAGVYHRLAFGFDLAISPEGGPDV